MKGRYMVDNPDGVVFTLKLTANAKEWEELRDQLATKWPSSELNGIITGLLSSARKVFYSEFDE